MAVNAVTGNAADPFSTVLKVSVRLPKSGEAIVDEYRSIKGELMHFSKEYVNKHYFQAQLTGTIFAKEGKISILTQLDENPKTEDQIAIEGVESIPGGSQHEKVNILFQERDGFLKKSVTVAREEYKPYKPGRAGSGEYWTTYSKSTETIVDMNNHYNIIKQVVKGGDSSTEE